MNNTLIEIITSVDPKLRNQSLETAIAEFSLSRLLSECAALDLFRRTSPNLYERVRALFFLYSIHRYTIPQRGGVTPRGFISFVAYEHLLNRRFEEAIDLFLAEQKQHGPSSALSSGIAAAYKDLAFATLANQVRRSVRSVKGNQWMFRVGHGGDHPLHIRPELMQKSLETGLYPILAEKTPVRMDLSHSGWSDIFFLGMDYPEGARVLNVSIDLAVKGRDCAPRPPVEAYLRVIDTPVLRLVSVDLAAEVEIKSLPEVFDFAHDYLGLLKAAVIAAGIIPPGLEGSGQDLAAVLAQIVGPGLGLEIVSNVNNIPKGSRLAVSTNLLAGLIAVCMRATGQAKSLTGVLQESERRLVAARAILGEWLGGSGGGWQDSGGVWPGMKLISGAIAAEGDPEYQSSRGRLLPNHRILSEQDCTADTRQKLQDSLVLVHGGMAQNVGPILEMVTERYLLRLEREWQGRQQATTILDEILAALKAGDVRRVGELTTTNFFEPIQTIIPWANNYYTEKLISSTRQKFGPKFWGFWMLGGMSGGGMGFIFDPAEKQRGQVFLQELMAKTRRELEHALPFAMEPVVYDFSINQNGTSAELLSDGNAILPAGYYANIVPGLLRADPHRLSPLRRAELNRFGLACRTTPELGGMVQTLFDRLFPGGKDDARSSQSLAGLLEANGFDTKQHQAIRSDLKNGRIGLAQNRLPTSTVIEDVRTEDVALVEDEAGARCRKLGESALAEGSVAVVSLAAGVGSRWTQGAGVVKALHPFARLGGKHRSFIEVHLAKSMKTGHECGTTPLHVITTSYLTHAPITQFLAAQKNYAYQGPLFLSQGRSIGLRFVPMVRDLRFAWEELPQRVQDVQKQKVVESAHHALMGWARSTGESTDYIDNLPQQCLHPVGHWYEIPNLFLNGTLEKMLESRPSLRYLMLHNIDTLGATLDPAVLGLHIAKDNCLSFEVITRRIEDRGGGLARVNGQVRLVEGLAVPREEEEFKLSYYNSMTTWIEIHKLLDAFGLTKNDLADKEKVGAAVRKVAAHMPTYITLKEVKKRWGYGQEDVYPVVQWEKLWGDMSALPGVRSGFFVVPRYRGQQLKEIAQLDGWLRDGSAEYVEKLCRWG